jgi:hypothetical protein
MPELTPEPDSTGDESKKLSIELFLRNNWFISHFFKKIV